MHTSKGSEKDGVKKLTKHLLITDHQNNARECLDIRNFFFRGNQNKIKYTFRMRYKCNRLLETNNSRIETRIRMTTGYSFGGAGRGVFFGGWDDKW